MSETIPTYNTSILLVFQHPPSNWKLAGHSHTCSEVLKLRACEWFGEAVGKIVAGGDIFV